MTRVVRTPFLSVSAVSTMLAVAHVGPAEKITKPVPVRIAVAAQRIKPPQIATERIFDFSLARKAGEGLR